MPSLSGTLPLPRKFRRRRYKGRYNARLSLWRNVASALPRRSAMTRKITLMIAIADVCARAPGPADRPTEKRGLEERGEEENGEEEHGAE